VVAALTPEEISRVAYHTGYMLTSFSGAGEAASLQYGIPRPVQTMFLVQQAVQLLTNPFAVDRCRRILFTLDDIERKLQSATCTLAVEKLGDMTLRGADAGKTFPDLLEREYVRWAKRLADLLGIPLYPYSARFRGGSGTGSIPVSNS